MILLADAKNRIVETVNIFETGSRDGEYDNITIYPDGKNNTFQITFGRSQTTEQGKLKDLVRAYIDNGGLFADDFAPFIGKIGVTPLAKSKTDYNKDFVNALQRAAREDEIMRTTQDAFFDAHYFQPAMAFCDKNGFKLPLSALVIYDSFIHSGGILDFLRKRFSEVPPVRGGDEKAWIKAYTKVRHEWLTSKGGLLAKTTYRTECFTLQMVSGNWQLTQPIRANGKMTRSIDIDASTEEDQWDIVRVSEEERVLLRGNGRYVKQMR